MSLKLRLALWYAGLVAVVVAVLALTAYGIYGRSQYLDIDRALADDAAHLAPLVDVVEEADVPYEVPDGGSLTSFVQLYGSDGAALGEPGLGAARSPFQPIAAMTRPDDQPYDPLLRRLPGGSVDAPGHFTTIASDDGHRVRIYTLPVAEADGGEGYVQSWASLAHADRAVARFRIIMSGLAAVSIIGVAFGGRAIAGLALHPVSLMIAAAGSIARSRSFATRIPEAPDESGDELARLARTFNEMLDALQSSYVAQQRFVADAAHELRAPLTVIRGNVELLARVHEMPPEDREEALRDLEQESLRLHRLVEELLQLARSDVGQPFEKHPVELDVLMLEVIAQLQVMPGADRISVGRVAPAVVNADPDRLWQLITILLDNALKYTPPPGGVSVDVSTTGEAAVLTVTDSGVGIPPADLPHVFDRFYRADPARSRDPGGTGLGLAIAKAIVEQHDGSIAIDSEPGRGTTVTVRLPAAAAVERARAPHRPGRLALGRPSSQR